MKLPFEKISIDGFRGLRGLQLEDMGPINILVGANNSGKTSVLEALSIMCNPFNPSEWLEMIRRRDFGGLDETRVQSLRWCFRQSGQLVDPDYEFEADCEFRSAGQFPLRKLIVEYKDIVGFPDERIIERLKRFKQKTIDFSEPWRGSELVHLVETDVFDPQTTLFDSGTHTVIEPVSLQLWENDPIASRGSRAPRSKRLPTDTLTPYSYQINSLQIRSHTRHLFQAISFSPRGRRFVIELVRKFDPDVVDLDIASFRGNRPAIYLNHRKLGPAPLSVFGDALRRAVLLASTLHMVQGGLLLIDEVETGIHISALENVFEWLIDVARDFNVQVVATTHSLEAVDSILMAAGDRIADLVTFHLADDDGQTRAKRIPGELLQRLRRERGLDVR